MVEVRVPVEKLLWDREIPCTREDSGSYRVAMVLGVAWGYSLGKHGREKTVEIFKEIQALHDHKGTLYVVYASGPLSPLVVEAINDAWMECHEYVVEFVPNNFSVDWLTPKGLREYRGQKVV